MKEQEPKFSSRKDGGLWKNRLKEAGITMIGGGVWISFLDHPALVAMGGITAFGGIGLAATADRIEKIIKNNKKGQKENATRSEKSSN